MQQLLEPPQGVLSPEIWTRAKGVWARIVIGLRLSHLSEQLAIDRFTRKTLMMDEPQPFWNGKTDWILAVSPSNKHRRTRTTN